MEVTVVYYGRWISAIHKVIQILEIAGDLSNMMSNIVSVFLHATGNGSKEPRTCVTSIVPCHIFQACSLKSKKLKIISIIHYLSILCKISSDKRFKMV